MLSSVDSLASLNGGIVIQVLGELSNHDAPSQKFAQTFFLAEQPTGYFVLNDIFRYIKEDIESDFDDAEPDSANEIDTPMLHEGQQGPNGLTNGFHSAAHSLVVDEVSPKPDPLQYSSSALGPEIDCLRDDEPIDGIVEEAPVELSKEAEMPLDTESASYLEVSNSASHELQATAELGPVEQGINLDLGSNVVQDEPMTAQNFASLGAPPAAVPKTWASLAATNADRWHAQPEAKPQAPSRAPVMSTKGNGNQPSTRKEVSKPG
jgi:Nuclear transport factor 2 (NTF2) domain